MAFAFAAYTIIFLGIAWYVFNIGQQQNKLSKQIEALEAALRSSEPAPQGAMVPGERHGSAGRA